MASPGGEKPSALPASRTEVIKVVLKTSNDLSKLCHAHDLDFLEFLVGMVCIQAEAELRDRAPHATSSARH